jgi:hypothetical protein
MPKHTKTAALVALAVAGLVAVGVIATGPDRSPAGEKAVPPVGPDAVLSSVDAAEGRESAGGGGGLPVAPAGKAGGETAAAAPPAGAQASSGPSSTIADQKVVQTAVISMQVKDVQQTFQAVSLLAASSGGFVASSKSSQQGGQTVASLTLRVPADRYQDVLAQVRAMGARVESESSNASDVTQEYSDLQAQLRNLQATEAQLLTFLGQAKNVGEVLQVQDRLTSVRGQIEQLQGRINLLDKLSDMATISVQLRPVAAAAQAGGQGTDLGAEVEKAWRHSLDFLGGIAAGVVSVAVFSWWVAVLAVPAVILWQRWSRGRAVARPSAGYD